MWRRQRLGLAFVSCTKEQTTRTPCSPSPQGLGRDPGPTAHSSLVDVPRVPAPAPAPAAAGVSTWRARTHTWGLSPPLVSGPCCLLGISCLCSPSIPRQMLGGGPVTSNGSRGTGSDFSLPCRSISHARGLICTKQTPGSSRGLWCAMQGLGPLPSSLACWLPQPACAPQHCSRLSWPFPGWLRCHPPRPGCTVLSRGLPLPLCTGILPAPFTPAIPSF